MRNLKNQLAKAQRVNDMYEIIIMIFACWLVFDSTFTYLDGGLSTNAFMFRFVVGLGVVATAIVK